MSCQSFFCKFFFLWNLVIYSRVFDSIPSWLLNVFGKRKIERENI